MSPQTTPTAPGQLRTNSGFPVTLTAAIHIFLNTSPPKSFASKPPHPVVTSGGSRGPDSTPKTLGAAPNLNGRKRPRQIAGVGAKTVGTRRTLGPGKRERIAKGDRREKALGRRCLQRPLPETRLRSQTFIDFRRPPGPAPAGPFPPASLCPPPQDTHSENPALRLEEEGPRSRAAVREGEQAHAPLLRSGALVTTRDPAARAPFLHENAPAHALRCSF